MTDAEGLLKNIFSGGHNNLEHQFVDIDGDGDLDIFYLDSDQTFGWFKNIGNKFNPEFEYSLTNPQGLFFSNWFYFVDIDTNSNLDFFRSNNGLMSLYENDGSNSAPVWTEFTNKFIPDNFGGNTFPSFADIDNDTDLDLFLGNVKGGLYLYINSEITNVADCVLGPVDNYSLEAFPNPFNPVTQIRIETKEAQKTTIEIFNLLGEKVKTLFNDNLPSGVTNFNWYGNDDSGEILPSGIYFILASSASNKKALKISFIK